MRTKDIVLTPHSAWVVPVGARVVEAEPVYVDCEELAHIVVEYPDDGEAPYQIDGIGQRVQ